jgi:hypothetical protein
MALSLLTASEAGEEAAGRSAITSFSCELRKKNKSQSDSVERFLQN